MRASPPRPMTTGFLAIASSVLAGCASLPTACPTSSQTTQWAQLAFGRAIGDQGQVSEEAFQRFIDTEVTPRFPDGLTILDARGQWRGADGGIVREPSKILLLALPRRGNGLKEVEEVREAYKRAFAQQSVMLVTQPACVAY